MVIGELRDNESVSLALTAAETGHIVLGTLNSTSAPKAIDRAHLQLPGRRAAADPRLALGVAQVRRSRSGCCRRRRPAQAGGVLRGAARHRWHRQHDPRREDVPDPLGDADRPARWACRPSTTRCSDLVTARPDQRPRPPTWRPPRKRTSRRPAVRLPRGVARGARGQAAMSATASAQDRPLPAPDDEPRRLGLPLTVGRPPMVRASGSMETIRYRMHLRERLRRADRADHARRAVGGVRRPTATSTTRTRSRGWRASA